MATLVFTVEVPIEKEDEIIRAIESTYGKPAAEVIADFVRDVYCACVIKSAEDTARDKAEEEADKVIIKGKT